MNLPANWLSSKVAQPGPAGCVATGVAGGPYFRQLMRFYKAEQWVGELLARLPWRWIGVGLLLAWAGAWAWVWWA